MPIIAVGRKQTAAVPGKTSSAQVDPNATNELEGALADQSQAVTNLGKTLANVAEKVTEHYEEIQEAKKENKATDIADQIYFEASIAYAEEVNTNTGDKAAGASERWNSRYGEIFSGRTEGLDEDTRKRVSDKLKESEMQWRVKVAANEGKQIRQAKVNLTQQEIDKLNKATYDAPDMLDQNLRYAISQIKSLKLSTDEESRAIDKVVEELHMAALRGMAERNPRTALELLDTPKFKAAFKSDESYLSAKKELEQVRKAADAQVDLQLELARNDKGLEVLQATQSFKDGKLLKFNPMALLNDKNGKPLVIFRGKDGARLYEHYLEYMNNAIKETEAKANNKELDSDPETLEKWSIEAINNPAGVSITTMAPDLASGKIRSKGLSAVLDLQKKYSSADEEQQQYLKQSADYIKKLRDDNVLGATPLESASTANKLIGGMSAWASKPENAGKDPIKHYLEPRITRQVRGWFAESTQKPIAPENVAARTDVIDTMEAAGIPATQENIERAGNILIERNMEPTAENFKSIRGEIDKSLTSEPAKEITPDIARSLLKEVYSKNPTLSESQARAEARKLATKRGYKF